MSYYRVFGAKRRHAKTRQMVTFSCFRMATFRPAIRKYDTFYASPFRLLFVISLPGGAKGRHAKTRQNHLLAGYRVATFAFSPRKHIYTTWHKSATIIYIFLASAKALASIARICIILRKYMATFSGEPVLIN